MKNYKIAVAGTGYVGLSLSVLLAQHNQVMAVDIVQAKVDMINNHKSPIQDDYIEKYLAEKELNLTATLDAKAAYSDADFVVIAAPTNYDSHTQHFDTSAVEAVIKLVMEYNPNAIMVIKSTIPVGYTASVREKFNSKNIIFSPEFLRESKALYDNLYPSRIIVGTDLNDERLVKVAHEFAGLLQEGAIKENIDTLFMGFTEAEAVKLFANTNGSRQIIAENCHEPYITKEQFHAFPCNMREDENKISTRKSYKKPNPLAKHIVCTCGRALCWHKDKKTGEELFYCRYCRAHKENGKNLKVPAATIYKNVMDALELEHLEEEKLTAAIQQGAGRKAIEVVRAEKSVQMKSVLAELNMEQFRRVPLYESYMANEITEEQYHAELMDYEEAHRKLNEQLTAIMEDTLVWERALSLRNPWIQQMAQYKTPEELDRNFVKKYIEQVTVTLLGDGQAEISLTMKTDEWKKMLGQIEMGDTDDGKKE